MTAPDPAVPPPRAVLDDGRRLRVVDLHDIGVEVKLLGVQPIDAPILLPHLLRNLNLAPLEGIVDALGRAEEERAPLDHLPAGLDSEIVEQRDQRVQHLGHPTAGQGGVDMEKGDPLESLC